MSSWIKLHRKIMERDDYFGEPFDRTHAWIDLLLLAKYKPCYTFVRGIKVHLEVGQIAISIRDLSKRWKWSRDKVVNFLKHLEEEKMVQPQKSNLTTLLSVVNFEEYQNTLPQTLPQNSPNTLPHTLPQNSDLTTSTTGHNSEMLKFLQPQTLPQNSDETSPLYINKNISISSSIIKEILEFWNFRGLEGFRLEFLNSEQEEKILERLNEFEGNSSEEKIAFAKKLILKFWDVPYLRGDFGRQENWKHPFDWLFANGENWRKVWEGFYDEFKQEAKPKAPSLKKNKKKGINEQWKDYVNPLNDFL